ncbi:hypothetical protein WME94_18080 [Sorangium sp. So ce429]
MSSWKKINALLAIAAPLGIIELACAMNAAAPEEPRGPAVAAETTADDGLGAPLSPLENAITANDATPDPTADYFFRDARMVCYHYYGSSYRSGNCRSFWFDNDMSFLAKNCDEGPCNEFPGDWQDKDWGAWSTGDGSKVICRGAWWPSGQQKNQLRVAYDNAPNC